MDQTQVCDTTECTASGSITSSYVHLFGRFLFKPCFLGIFIFAGFGFLCRLRGLTTGFATFDFEFPWMGHDALMKAKNISRGQTFAACNDDI